MRSMIVTMALVLLSAAQAEALSFTFDWTVIASGKTFTGSSAATVTPSTISPTTLDAFPGSSVYDLAFGAGFGGPVVDPSWGGGSLTVPNVGEARNFGASSFSLRPGGDGFSLSFSFKALGPSPSDPIIVGSLSGTGSVASGHAPEPEVAPVVLLALLALVWLGRGRLKRSSPERRDGEIVASGHEPRGVPR